MLDKSQLVRTSLFALVIASLVACSGAGGESEGGEEGEQSLSQDDNSGDKREILASSDQDGGSPEDDAGSWHATDGGSWGHDGGSWGYDGGYHGSDAGFGGQDSGSWHYGDGGSSGYDAGFRR
jgi:hypothetical protein